MFKGRGRRDARSPAFAVGLVLRWLGMRRPLIWVACPTAAQIIDRLPSAGVAYQLSDFYGSLQGDRSAPLWRWNSACGPADLIVCSSERLLEPPGGLRRAITSIRR